jgi:hypothetical protein
MAITQLTHVCYIPLNNNVCDSAEPITFAWIKFRGCVAIDGI